MDRRKSAGVTIRSKTGIEIDFPYQGKRCRETVKLPPTPNNLEFVRRKRDAILYEIGRGSFNYAEHFPNSPYAARLGKGSLQTVAQALRAWLIAAAKRCERSTLRDYESSVNFHLEPAFGKKLLTELSASDIREFITFLKISPKRINNILVPLRGMLADAFSDEVIDRNPMERWPRKTERDDK